MVNAWEASTVVAGAVGFFTVLRGSAFAAHALPNGAFAGASLIGANVLVGLGVFALLGALTVGGLGRRARRDVATALAFVMMLGLGALFLWRTTEYIPEIFSLLFGQVLGVSSAELLPTSVPGGLCLVAVVMLWPALLLSSGLPEAVEARGVRGARLELTFLIVLALATVLVGPGPGLPLQPPHRILRRLAERGRLCAGRTWTAWSRRRVAPAA